MSENYGKNCAIKYCEKIGRYITASENIRAGEIILYDNPILILPQWDSKLLCSNCYRESCTVCKQCNIFPLCFMCKTHNDFDCEFFTNKNVPKNFLLENFGLFSPLKCLLFLENVENTEKSKKFLQLESHIKERKCEMIWENLLESICKPLENFQINKLFKNYTVELIQKICGILDVNAFEVRGHEDESLRGIYTDAAMLAHNCISNTTISVDENFRMKLYATVDIKIGETIYYNYTNPLMGTEIRRTNLLLGKYFECHCKRCEDPTELGTYISCLKCQHCSSWLLNTSNTTWNCDNCNLSLTSNEVNRILSDANKQVIAAENDLRQMEILINKFSKIFHPNHYIIIDLKQNVASFLRQICNDAEGMGAQPPSTLLLQRKLQLCTEILPVLRKLQPGISRLTAIALYESSSPLFELAKRNKNGTNKEDYKAKLLKIEEILKESVSMLLHEPPKTPEGMLARKILLDLKCVKDEIKEQGN